VSVIIAKRDHKLSAYSFVMNIGIINKWLKWLISNLVTVMIPKQCLELICRSSRRCFKEPKELFLHRDGIKCFPSSTLTNSKFHVHPHKLIGCNRFRLKTFRYLIVSVTKLVWLDRGIFALTSLVYFNIFNLNLRRQGGVVDWREVQLRQKIVDTWEAFVHIKFYCAEYSTTILFITKQHDGVHWSWELNVFVWILLFNNCTSVFLKLRVAENLQGCDLFKQREANQVSWI
jgi:hypothetical protein